MKRAKVSQALFAKVAASKSQVLAFVYCEVNPVMMPNPRLL